MLNNERRASEDERAPAWLTEREAAAHLRYTLSGLRHLRYQGNGPRYAKNPVGAVRYRVADLDAWAAAGASGDDQ